MTGKRLLDTNVIIRHLTQDNPRQASAASRLISACDSGEIRLVLLSGVLAECVFVLESFYRHPRRKIAEVLSSLLESPGIELTGEAIHLDALARYGASKAHFVDCVIAAHAAALAIPVATFDADFDAFPDVQRIVP